MEGSVMGKRVLRGGGGGSQFDWEATMRADALS